MYGVTWINSSPLAIDVAAFFRDIFTTMPTCWSSIEGSDVVGTNWEPIYRKHNISVYNK